jgi:hypothetical protein
MNRRTLGTLLIAGMLVGCAGPRETGTGGRNAGIAPRPQASPPERERGSFAGEEWFWLPVGQHQPTFGDIRPYLQIADDPKQDRRSRCLAIFSAFADHVRPGCTSREFARLLGAAPWIDDAAISRGTSGSGWWPIFAGEGESIFDLRLFPKDEAWGDYWGIYIVLSHPASPEDPCCPDVEPLPFLRGAVSDDSVQIREFVLCYPSGVFKTFAPGWIGVLYDPTTYLTTSTLLDAHYGHLYLHIPDNEAWPESDWLPDDQVCTNRYSRITQVSHVSQEQYDQDLQHGRMLFQESHGGARFYATERVVDAGGDSSDTVLLERKVYP